MSLVAASRRLHNGGPDKLKTDAAGECSPPMYGDHVKEPSYQRLDQKEYRITRAVCRQSKHSRPKRGAGAWCVCSAVHASPGSTADPSFFTVRKCTMTFRTWLEDLKSARQLDQLKHRRRRLGSVERLRP